jgi:hypothetical protein
VNLFLSDRHSTAGWGHESFRRKSLIHGNGEYGFIMTLIARTTGDQNQASE